MDSNFALNRPVCEGDHRFEPDDKAATAIALRSNDIKNQKLKRLSIDDNNQPYRKSITFNDDHPVKVTAKFDYIDGSRDSVFTAEDMSERHDDNTRFPKIEEMAHFHYDTVDFSSPLQMCIFQSKQSGKMTPVNEDGETVKVKVSCREKSWVISRSLSDFVGMDLQFHKCIFDRQYTGLESLKFLRNERVMTKNLMERLIKYMNRLSRIAGNTIWCGPILNWFEVDNKGNHLMLTEDSAINVPAIAAASVIKRYTAQASDEISFEVGDIVSVIDMPPYEESSWWRGKREFEVGFFPSQCVKVIGDTSATVAPQKLTPVASKRGKVVSYLRTFLSSRPSRVRLLQSGILRERTFGCDLGEHLQRTGREIPLVVEMCAKLIEKCGITNGVYRHSGMSTNVQKIRLMFDSEESPILEQDCFLRDIHCVGNVLKMYFRELPNPLLTYHLYEKFTSAVRIKDGFDREIAIHHVVQQLPPPHYKTVEFLLKHLAKLADYHNETGMHAKNLSIVWAPNLMRTEKMEESSSLEHLGSQAVVVEFLIRNVDIFFDKDTAARAITRFPDSPKHGMRERSHSDPSISESISLYDRSKIRPSSVGVAPAPKLISLEEARSSRNPSKMAQTESVGVNNKDVPLAEQEESSPDLSSPEQEGSRGGSPLSPVPGNPLKPGKTYIDVGEGPSALPEYHTVIELPRGKKTNITRGSKKWKSLFGKRPESTRTSSHNSSFRRPPLRQRSFEDAIKKDEGKVRSKSVDELSSEENKKGKSLSISYPLSRNRYNPQESGGKITATGKSKFYVEPDLPPEGMRGTFAKAQVGSPDARRINTAGSNEGVSENSSKRADQRPPRPATSPPGYQRQVRQKSRSDSPGRVNGDESTFFVTGRVNQQTNALSIGVVRAPGVNSLKSGMPVANEENGSANETKK
ncbi:rho GTPase-activating protein 32-like [Dendronephthya gigantea]|uniref:rho GTPase-activating protein 32-like n=1 Tax=Dendronephthya gigantea TaxID=151771 RepID=UPI00106CFED0|nr:rho GTPase-activating protein 32-like [Dendronephthya gigantea]XP_028406303.1 rho GTPase-activating protein 32-like [Dendronephthya gigantea]